MPSSLIGTRAALRTLLAGLLIATPAVASAQTPRISVSVNGGWQGAPDGFEATTSLQLNRETEEVTARYDFNSGPLFDIGGAVRLTRHLWAGVAISRFSKPGESSLTARLPHPLLFNQPRTVEGTVGLGRRETAGHIQALWDVPLGEALTVRVFGGPSIFSLKQDVVSDVEFSETYPFDAATFTSAKTSSVTQTKLGFNVGADLAYYFHPMFGVGFLARYASAPVDLQAGTTGTVSAKTGGFQLGGGRLLVLAGATCGFRRSRRTDIHL